MQHVACERTTCVEGVVEGVGSRPASCSYSYNCQFGRGCVLLLCVDCKGQKFATQCWQPLLYHSHKLSLSNLLLLNNSIFHPHTSRLRLLNCTHHILPRTLQGGLPTFVYGAFYCDDVPEAQRQCGANAFAEMQDAWPPAEWLEGIKADAVQKVGLVYVHALMVAQSW